MRSIAAGQLSFGNVDLLNAIAEIRLGPNINLSPESIQAPKMAGGKHLQGHTAAGELISVPLFCVEPLQPLVGEEPMPNVGQTGMGKPLPSIVVNTSDHHVGEMGELFTCRQQPPLEVQGVSDKEQETLVKKTDTDDAGDIKTAFAPPGVDHESWLGESPWLESGSPTGKEVLPSTGDPAIDINHMAKANTDTAIPASIGRMVSMQGSVVLNEKVSTLPEAYPENDGRLIATRTPQAKDTPKKLLAFPESATDGAKAPDIQGKLPMVEGKGALVERDISRFVSANPLIPTSPVKQTGLNSLPLEPVELPEWLSNRVHDGSGPAKLHPRSQDHFGGVRPTMFKEAWPMGVKENAGNHSPHIRSSASNKLTEKDFVRRPVPQPVEGVPLPSQTKGEPKSHIILYGRSAGHVNPVLPVEMPEIMVFDTHSPQNKIDPFQFEKTPLPLIDFATLSVREGSESSEIPHLFTAPKQIQTLTDIIQKAVWRQDNGLARVNIQLKPEFLGQLNMDVLVDNQKVSIEIRVETIQLKEFLEAGVHLLKTELQGSGLDVERIDVLVDHHLNGQKGNPWSANHKQMNFEQPDIKEIEDNEIEKDTLTNKPVLQESAAGRIDCYV